MAAEIGRDTRATIDRVAAGFGRGVKEVLFSPSVAFFRLAGGGGWLAPVVLAAVAGVFGGGAVPLRALVSLPSGTGFTAAAVGGYLAITLFLFPIYYAGTVLGLSLVGVLVGRGTTGLTLKEAFWRCWRVLGWVNLPLVGLVAATAAARALVRPDLGPALATVPPPATPVLNIMFCPPALLTLLFVVMAAWTLGLLVIALRHALAESTGKVWATLLIAGFLFGGFVHTPVAIGVGEGFRDAWSALKPERSVVFVDPRAYHAPGAGPERGELVAYTQERPGGSPPVRYVFHAVGLEINSGSSPYLARVIGLPGDTVRVTGGRVELNGVILAEDYLNHLGDASVAFPPDLSISELTVSEGHLYVLPDNRLRLLSQAYPRDFGPIVAVERLWGKVASFTVTVWLWGKP